MDPITGISLLFSGIPKVKELFSAGKKLKEDISGTPSQASTIDELKGEIVALPLEQQTNFIDQMKQYIDMYDARTERIKTQEEIAPEIAAKVDEETASKIAYQRQTTRPWCVRMMVHLMLFPFYLVILDVVQHVAISWLLFWTDRVKPFESFIYVFGTKDGGLMDKLGNVIGPMPKTLAGQMYLETVMYAAAIIISFMGLREMGKSRDKEKGDGIISKVIKKSGLIGKLFGR